ncbi:hypothetical protein HZH68_009305 [Vespula germanica]|uniref:Uncharacterized protein n=1 Tax=Vespula germanica TaxID=30212 RepID=A0A834N498_VESGE|nr:hypothetical protein HZH68_009305 [Vespula germanica]
MIYQRSENNQELRIRKSGTHDSATYSICSCTFPEPSEIPSSASVHLRAAFHKNFPPIDNVNHSKTRSNSDITKRNRKKRNNNSNNNNNNSNNNNNNNNGNINNSNTNNNNNNNNNNERKKGFER